MSGLAEASTLAPAAADLLDETHPNARELLGSMPAAIYTTDAEGRITYYNEAAAALWGWHPPLGESEWCGSWKLYWPDGRPMPHAECPMALALKEQVPIRGLEAIAERPDGSRLSFVPYPTPLFDAAGKLTGAINMLVDITGRKMMETALRQSEARLSAIVGQVKAGIAETDLSGRFTLVNQRYCEMVGYTESELYRMKMQDITHPDDLPRNEEMFARLTEDGADFVIEKRYIRKDGGLVWVNNSVSAIRGLDGRVSAVAAVSIDVTDRKRIEDTLRNSGRELAEDLGATQHLQEMSTVLMREGDAGALYDRVVEVARSVMHSDAASLQMLDATRGQLKLLAWKGFHPDSAKFWDWVRIDSESTCGEALSGGRRVVVPDTELCDFMAGSADLEEYRRSEIRGVQSTPLVSRSGRLLGMISTHWRKPHDPGERDLRLLDVLARQAADLIERTNIEAVLRLNSQRLDALNRVARTLSRDLDLKRIVQAATDSATALSGAKFGAFFYNVTDEAGERYTLYTLSGAPREAFEKFGLPRNTAVFDPTFRGVATVRSDDIRADPRYGQNAPHYGMPAGHLPVVSYLAVPVVSRSGAVHGGLFFGHDRAGVFTKESAELVEAIAAQTAVAMDNANLLKNAHEEVEQRKQAELASRRLAVIVESSNDAIVSKNLDGIVLTWNKGAERLFGYTEEEIVGRPITTIIPTDRLHEETDILARIRRGERVDYFDTVRRRKDGTLVHVSVSISPVKDADGRTVGASKIARDIGERKRAEEQKHLLLREMNHRVKNLAAVASSIVTLSARSAHSAEEMAEAVRARLEALVSAHDLVRPIIADGGEAIERDATLEELIRTILAPYTGSAAPESQRQCQAEGPDVPLGGSAATNLALVLHELATNAVKYGALSTPTGRVRIDWSIEDDKLLLHWTEGGGPPVTKPSRGVGFGSRLAHASITKQLDGRIVPDWRPEGLAVHVSVPLDRLRA